MAMNNQLVEAFNDCIDRLNRGETIDTILRDYPDLATQLHPMLEAGLVIKKTRYPLSEVLIAQENITPQIEAAINATFAGGSTPFNWYALVLILLVVGGIVAGIFALNQANAVPPVEATFTSLPASPSEHEFASGTLSLPVESTPNNPQVSPTVTASLTATVTVTATTTPTATITATSTATATVTATVTVTPSTTPTLTATLVPTMAVTIIIEGPVSKIEGNIITIFNETIALPPDDERLTVIQLGDVLRVQTATDGQSTVALDITFVNVLVVVSVSGQIWRGDDCNNPPPAWIDGNTNAWYSLCYRSNTNNSSSSGNSNNSNNSSNNSSDDDDDDDDDDDGDD